MIPFLPVVIALLLAMICITAQADTITGRVVSIQDGDTITLLVAGDHRVKVRLSSIDAPELAQPYGNNAKQVLSELVFGKDVRVEGGLR